jgi:hypothetical protein
MSVQPDMRAVGPRARTADEGFDVGFEDLPTGHINQLNVEYFQYLDQIVDILVQHDLVPVWSPVFQGYGWKGLGVAGLVVPPVEYARYCRYLVLATAPNQRYISPGPTAWIQPRSQPAATKFRPGLPNRPIHISRTVTTAHQRLTETTVVPDRHTGERSGARRNIPPKGVANAEPVRHPAARTTATAGGRDTGVGNVTGGVGVVYGAANI